MLPGPLTVQVMLAVELVTENACEPPIGTAAEFGVTRRLGGGGVLLPPPPHPVKRKATLNKIKRA
jgi:hypothetical protein